MKTKSGTLYEMRVAKKEAVYDYVKQHIKERGYAPSLEEICAGVGIRSKATVAYNLNWLKAEGRVDWEQNKSRTLRITERGK